MIRVEQLFISPGHNFVGHYGGPPGRNPLMPVAEVECVAGRGLRGDRYFDREANHKGQITFFSLEVFEGLCRELKLVGVEPQATRRNAFVRGADLNALVGRTFEIQGVRFEGVEESRPCDWMNLALGPGARDWLNGQGGLRARILDNGVLRREG